MDEDLKGRLTLGEPEGMILPQEGGDIGRNADGAILLVDGLGVGVEANQKESVLRRVPRQRHHL